MRRTQKVAACDFARIAGYAVLFSLAGLSFVGCTGQTQRPTSGQGSPSPQPPGAVISNTDACATRLHDLCGPLLLYYGIRHHLPEQLEELSRLPGFEGIRDFTCPVSGKPYVYDPDGTISSAPPSRVILYDPEPSHSGLRWAVSIIEPDGDAPLVTKVIALPEAYFSRRIGPARP